MKKNKVIQTLAILLISALPLTVTIAYSKSDDSRRPQSPPPEAIKACESKKTGETTTFTGRRGETLTATCIEIEGQLAAVPEGGPH